MIRPFLTVLACCGLISCGSVSPLTNEKLSELESQVLLNQQKQDELYGLLNDIAAAQIESTESIESELRKTQELVAINITRSNTDEGTGAATSPHSSSSASSRTKAEWLEQEGKVLVGGVEHFTFSAEDLTFEARIDTGATSSSLDAREITRFERDGDRWVRFKLFVDDEHVAEVERPLVRLVRVYQSSGAEEGERRPVVEMAYTFGDLEDTAEFTLTDRSHLEYSVLIGRNIMTDRMIVDVSDSYLFNK